MFHLPLRAIWLGRAVNDLPRVLSDWIWVAPDLFLLMKRVQAAIVVSDDWLKNFKKIHFIGLGFLPLKAFCCRDREVRVQKTNTVEGNKNRIPVRTWFIHQAGLRFPISPLLKEVMARCRFTFIQVSVNFVRTVLAMDGLMLREGLPFNASDLLHVYNDSRALDSANQASTPTTFSALSSSSSLGLSSSSEVEVGEEVYQGKVAISTPAPVLGVALILVESSGGGAEMSSEEVYMGFKAQRHWSPKGQRCSSEKSLNSPSNLGFSLSFPYSTCFSCPPFGRPELAILPFAQVTQREGVRCWDFEEEKARGKRMLGWMWRTSLRRMRKLLPIFLSCSMCRAFGGLRLIETASTNTRPSLKRPKRKPICGELMLPRKYECGSVGIHRASEGGHNPSNTAALEVEVPGPPEPYLLILLLDYNEEEYVNYPAEDGVEGGSLGDSEVANKLGDKIETSRAGGEDHIPPKV
ncbi:hypothetical protein Acr_22g0009810 [Actinidia rufa]|uniref:Uncharacterized protein n=1 Tax=Actinidia rufa TaxID=165716 RepID=A0A7J0GLA4_9ERIC|nr:hypothetical protein Acr_22g0009810 [Actinidia rufa]